MNTLNTQGTRAPNFGNACQRFVDAGFAPGTLIPIIPPGPNVEENKARGLGKAPGRYLTNEQKWVGLQDWQRVEGLSPRTCAEAANWPTGNVGVPGRLHPAIDCDVESEAARRLVERAVRRKFGIGYAERVRDNSPRRLYALQSKPGLDGTRQVQKQKLKFRLKDDPEGTVLHVVEILGAGQQFVAAGIHPSGANYGWKEDADLCAMVKGGWLEEVEQADMLSFTGILKEEIEKAGGTLMSASSEGAGGGIGQDYSREAPIKDPALLIAALNKMPNTRANFPEREDFVLAVAAFKAAAGERAAECEEAVREWSVAADPAWGYEGEQFDKIWGSTHKVYVARDYLLVLLAKRHQHPFAADHFTDDAAEQSKVIGVHKDDAQTAKDELLARVAAAYVFQHVDTSTGKKFPPMRLKADPTGELDASEWYQGRSTDRDVKLLDNLHREFGKGKDGLFGLQRDLLTALPLAFYRETTRHPDYDRGVVIPTTDDPDRPEGQLNMRRQSQARIAARKSRRDPELAKADVAHFRKFVQLGFGDPDAHVPGEGVPEKFVLDTLAYMIQTSKRPGCMFYLVGDQGVGKSIFVEMLIALFDGTGPGMGHRINGAKLTNENARRFMLIGTAGNRVIPLQEMPKNARPADQDAILSELKQAVDPSPAGDWLQVEDKGGKIHHIRNHGLVVVTTNHEKALQIEEQDRRTFYAPFRITAANKPGRAFYSRLVDMTEDAERLAAVWQYLETRDIVGYDATLPPPTSAEKFALQVANIRDDAERHLEIAVRTLRHNERWIFGMADIVQLMNEAWRLEGHSGGAPDIYTVDVVGKSGLSAGAYTRLGKLTDKRAYKSDAQRAPTLYALKARAPDLMALRRAEAFRALTLDREHHPLTEMVRITPYKGALDLPPLDGAENDNETVPGAVAVGRQVRGRPLH